MNQPAAYINTRSLPDRRNPPADRAKASRNRTWASWACTSATAFAFASMGVADFVQAVPIMQGLDNLDHPACIATVLETWKLLAATVLLTPGLPRVTEWAYAGMFFTLTSAVFSHAFNHDAEESTLAPLLLLAAAMTTCGLRGHDGSRHGAVPRHSGVENHVEY